MNDVLYGVPVQCSSMPSNTLEPNSKKHIRECGKSRVVLVLNSIVRETRNLRPLDHKSNALTTKLSLHLRWHCHSLFLET